MTPYRQRIYDIISGVRWIEEHALTKIIYAERWEHEYSRHSAWVRAVGQACWALHKMGKVNTFLDRNGYPYHFKVSP